MNDADCTTVRRALETIEEGTHRLVGRIAELEAELEEETALRRQAMDENEVQEVEIERLKAERG